MGLFLHSTSLSGIHIPDKELTRISGIEIF